MARLKQILTSIVMILGLNSLVDDAVAFVGFVATANETYAVFRSTLFDLLHLNLPDPLRDYLIIGTAVGVSYVSADRKYPGWSRQDDGRVARALTGLLSILAISVTWPLITFITLLVVPMSLRGEEIGYGTTGSGQPVAFVINLCLTAAAFFVLLFVFSDVVERYF